MKEDPSSGTSQISMTLLTEQSPCQPDPFASKHPRRPMTTAIQKNRPKAACFGARIHVKK